MLIIWTTDQLVTMHISPRYEQRSAALLLLNNLFLRRTRQFIKLTILCSVAIWLLGVLSGFVVMFLPQNGATSTALIGFTNDKSMWKNIWRHYSIHNWKNFLFLADSTITTLNYETNFTTNGSLEITDLSGLADQVMIAWLNLMLL